MADVLLFASHDGAARAPQPGRHGQLTYVPRRGAGERRAGLRHRARRGGDRRRGRAQVDRRRSYDRDGRLAAAGTARRGRARRAAGRPLLRRAAAQEHRTRALRRRLRGGAARARARPRRRRHRGRAHRAQRGGRRGALDAAGRRRSSRPAAAAIIRGSWPRSTAASRRCRAAIRSGASSDLFFPGDAKEAVAFALLGYLTLHGQPGNVPAATGAGRRTGARHGDPGMSDAFDAAHRPTSCRRCAPGRGRRLRPRGRPDRRRARPRRRRLHHLRRHRGIGPPAHGRPAAPGRAARCSSRRTWSGAPASRSTGSPSSRRRSRSPSLGDAAVVRWAGAVTAQEARAVGINWVFAPVGDLDVASRQSDRADARLRRRPEPRRQPGPDLDRGLPGRGRARLRQALSGARPHDGRLPHRPAGRDRCRAATLRDERPAAVRASRSRAASRRS